MYNHNKHFGRMPHAVLLFQILAPSQLLISSECFDSDRFHCSGYRIQEKGTSHMATATFRAARLLSLETFAINSALPDTRSFVNTQAGITTTAPESCYLVAEVFFTCIPETASSCQMNVSGEPEVAFEWHSSGLAKAACCVFHNLRPLLRLELF